MESSHPINILVLDDDENMRELYAFYLNKFGFNVCTASHSSQAITAVQRAVDQQSPFGAAILDLNIRADIGGLQIANRLRAIDPEIKLIVSSSDSDGDVMRHYQHYGFAAALEKNFDRAAIKSVLDRALGVN